MSKIDISLMKVLVIDDQSFIRTIIVTLLCQMGFTMIKEAEDGASGLKAFNSFRPNLIICDIEMEPIDGLVFLQTIRESKDIENSNVPFVFLTHLAEADIVKQARQLGVDSFVIKPTSYDTLKNRIQHALNHHMALENSPCM